MENSICKLTVLRLIVTAIFSNFSLQYFSILNIVLLSSLIFLNEDHSDKLISMELGKIPSKILNMTQLGEIVTLLLDVNMEGNYVYFCCYNCGLFQRPSKYQKFNFILIIAIKSCIVRNLIIKMGNLTIEGQDVTPVRYCYKASFYEILSYLIMFHFDNIFEYSL